jgi:RNA polymerase sigma-70 factor (ECF subfamily)
MENMQTPRSLLERLRSDPDAEAWERLVTLYTPWMARVLQQARVAEPDRDDLQQEVLTTLVRELPKFEHNGRTGAFRSWLRIIVVNRLQMYWRTKRSSEQRIDGRRDVDELISPFSELEDFWDREHDRYLTQELLKLVEASFSQTVWQAFRRQMLDGTRAADVAAELGISVNAVLLAKSRVLQRLRAEADGLIDDL